MSYCLDFLNKLNYQYSTKYCDNIKLENFYYFGSQYKVLYLIIKLMTKS